MATLTVQTSNLTSGLEPTYASAAGGGDQFANSGKEFLHVKNGGGGAVTVTIDSQTNCNFGHDHNIAVSVGAGEEWILGPFPKSRFNDSSGLVQITYSGVTSVTVAVIKIGG